MTRADQGPGPESATLAREAAPALNATLAALLALAALNAFFALDVAWRVWETRSGFDRTGDALVIVLYEVARAAAVALALAGAVLLARRRAAYGVPLALAVAALAVWYATSFGFPGFAGYAQTRIALALRAAGVPSGLVVGLFGDAVWPLWIAVAGALRAGALLLAGSGATGHSVRSDTTSRAGLLRGSAVAGLDVGALFLRAAAATVERGWLAPAPVWGTAAAGVVLHFASPALRTPLLLVLALGGALAFTLFRTVYRRGSGDAQAVLRWVSLGAALALAGFLIGGTFAVVVPGAAALSFFVLATTPLLVAGCLAAAGRA